MLTVRDLTKTFPGDSGAVTVLDAVSMDLGAGETLALTGESGSGKSTLLHIIGGLEPADEGTVMLGDTEVTGASDAARATLRRQSMGIVFQQFNLIPSLDLEANVAFQARLAGEDDPDWRAALIDRLGLAAHRAKYPEALSGGQQQRVAIGRALAARPRLILADEPTGNLDEETAATVLDLMLELSGDAGAALLIVTHSDRLASRLSRRLHLSRGKLQ